MEIDGEMFTHRHYVPILKWKLGEYQALDRLTHDVKDGLTPLIEVPPVGYDFEAGRDRESVDDHLGDFGRRLRSKWQARSCFVDLWHLRDSARLRDGRHCVEAVFEDTRREGCRAIPVLSLAHGPDFLAAIAAVARTDRRGVCLRLSLADFDRRDLATDISARMIEVGTSLADMDLVIDLNSANFIPMTAFVRTSTTLIDMVPHLNRWRTFTVAGASYPQSIAGIAAPHQLVPRQEWIAHRMLVSNLGSGTRIPSFGDYVVAHPELVELDMPIIKPFAKLRYTIDDHWHIGRGTPVRTHGFGQYRQLCADLVAQSYFDGRGYSAGDDYIADCAAGRATTGNLSTWVWVSSNRHMTKVVADLATFHGILAAA